MVYLEAAEYVQFGLSGETRDDLVVAASAMIDAFCRRPSLGVTEYVERLRFPRGSFALQVSNAPVAAVTRARVRLSRRHGNEAAHPLAFAAEVYGLTGAWTDVDVSTVEIAANGEVCFQPHFLGVPFDNAEVTYTAGFVVIPEAVKVACAGIVRNAEAMPALTVKRQAIDSMQMEYFSGSLLDADVQRLLKPYVSERLAG